MNKLCIMEKAKHIGIVSGYFNPLHFGHIEYINASKNLCDELVVIVNNDHQVKLKKSKPFMDALHRCNIMHSIKGVDFAIISQDIDNTVCETIRYIRTIWPNVDMTFYNSGDRTSSTVDSSEEKLCKVLNINSVIIPLKKIYSSRELIKNI
jgi:cytidyltransferase-like protein